jgi:uncharacterized membrane protein
LSNLILRSRRQALIIALFFIGAVLLVLPFYRPADVPLFFLFVGRLHPLILHFPIVLIILALLFEVASRFYRMKIGEYTVMVILVAAALSTLVSVTAGFFLYASGDYSGELMDQHFWAGAITGAAIFFTIGFFFLYRSSTRFYYLYFAGLLFTNAAVGYASHLGGSITHGKDYLTEHLDFIMSDLNTNHAKPESEMLVYDDMIAPIFEAKCLSCHNEQKAKGGLLMTSYESLLKAGESDHPSITPGRPMESEIFNRVILPKDHKDHMPPEGKTPMTDAEISLLQFWITSGAGQKLKVAEARKVDSIGPVVRGLLPDLAKYRRKASLENMKLNALESELKQVAERLGIIIHRDSLAEENHFAIAMKFPPAPFTNETFRELSPYFGVFSKVSLVSSDVDDSGLYYIGQMTNLRELYVQKTTIDGSGLVYLQQLPNLAILNLSFTKVDDKAAIDLLKLHSLKEVYLYRTRTSTQVIEALRKNKPEVQFLLEEGPYF